MTESTSKVAREARARRAARRQGLYLVKSSRRDTRALDYGKWRVFNQETNALVCDQWGITLDEVEAMLRGDDEDDPAERVA